MHLVQTREDRTPGAFFGERRFGESSDCQVVDEAAAEFLPNGFGIGIDEAEIKGLDLGDDGIGTGGVDLAVIDSPDGPEDGRPLGGQGGIGFEDGGFRQSASWVHHAWTGLKLELAVELERAACEHKIAFLEAGLDDVLAACARSQNDLPALKGGIAFRAVFDIDDGALAGAEHGGGGDEERQIFRAVWGDEAQVFSAFELHAADVADPWCVLDDLGVHGTDPFSREVVGDDVTRGVDLGIDETGDKGSRFEEAVFVLDVHADADDAALAIKHGVDKSDPPVELATRNRITGKDNVLGKPDPGEIGLVGFEIDPDHVEVGDGVEFLSGGHVVALARNFLDDDAILWSRQYDMVGGLLFGFHGVDAISGNAEKAEAFASGVVKKALR